MITQTSQILNDAQVLRVIEKIHNVLVAPGGYDPQRLQAVLKQGRMQFGRLRDAVSRDMITGGALLQRFEQEVFNDFLKKRPVERRYVVRAVCPSCAPEDDRSFGRRKTYVSEKNISYYLDDSAMSDEEVLKNSKRTKCGCGTRLKVVSSGNMLIPKRDAIFKFFMFRQKDPGSLSDKLTEIICDPESERNIQDVLGLYSVFDVPHDLTVASKRKIKNAMRRRYQTNIVCDTVKHVEEQMQYALFDVVKQWLMYRGRSIYYDKIDDHYENPRVREEPYIDEVSGEIKLARAAYQAHHIPFDYMGMTIEWQLKPLRVYQEENNPRSPISHFYMKEKAEKGRLQKWTSAHHAVNQFISGLFDRGAGRNIDYRRQKQRKQ